MPVMHRARAELNAQSDSNEHSTDKYGIETPNPAFWEPPCRDAACALHILILPFARDLPSHNNAYVFLTTRDNDIRAWTVPCMRVTSYVRENLLPSSR